jgi:hypothetical protein
MDNFPHEILQQGSFTGPRFRGVFFFQDVFWRVTVPLVMGTRQASAIDALSIMPQEMKQRLCSRDDAVRQYLLLWADCIDYDSGFQASHAIAVAGSFLGEMIDSTERELTSAITDLCQQRPNSKAMHSARDATEKALKAYLAHYANLTRARAKNEFGHKVDKLMQEVARHKPQSPLLEVDKHRGAFAPYEDRYTSTTYTWSELWGAYRLAQFTAAEVLRSITGRNQRANVQCHPVFTGA